MNSATARTVREACGLAHRDIADALNINVRTVQRWESVASEEDIPPYAEQYYLDCLDWLTTTVATVVDSVLDEAEKSGDPRVVNLSRYVNQNSANRAGFTRPVGLHSAAQAHILALLYEAGINCQVEYVPPE